MCVCGFRLLVSICGTELPRSAKFCPECGQHRRRALHGRIAEVPETLDPRRLAEQIERVAHHALREKLWVKAVTYLRQAGALRQSLFPLNELTKVWRISRRGGGLLGRSGNRDF